MGMWLLAGLLIAHGLFLFWWCAQVKRRVQARRDALMGVMHMMLKLNILRVSRDSKSTYHMTDKEFVEHHIYRSEFKTMQQLFVDKRLGPLERHVEL